MADVNEAAYELPKSRTGIEGFDEITGGGLPMGRPTLVAGGAGAGKTLFAMEFLVNGATQLHEPGVFVSFEESVADLTKNVASMGIRLDELERERKIDMDYVHIERSEILETGEYNLDGLFVRLASAIDSIGAKRIVLDTLESLFSGLPNQAILRSEIRRLFAWLREKGITAVVTAEKGENGITRHGLEEYISDCVIFLDHKLQGQVATRNLRILKYRGSGHGTNEYPFLIGKEGITVLPITSLGLNHEVSKERVSTGIERLDTMLSGGYYRGSSVLVSGTAGTGKTSIAAFFAESVCRGGERCLYIAFEESQSQIVRNMLSIGLDLEQWVDRGLLRFQNVRPNVYGIEMHLVSIYKLITDFEPSAVILDPTSNMLHVGSPWEVKSMLMRLIDFLKSRHITSLFTKLLRSQAEEEDTESGVSSLIDTWILVRDIESGGERNRRLQIIKSRGMPHSNQVREFLLTSEGIQLIDVYTGPEGVLTGAARLSQEAREKAEHTARRQEIQRRRRELERKRRLREARIAAINAEFEAEEEELTRAIEEEALREVALRENTDRMACIRHADSHVECADHGFRSEENE